MNTPTYVSIYVYVLLGHYNPIWYGVSKEVGREGHMKTVKIFSGTQKKYCAFIAFIHLLVYYKMGRNQKDIARLKIKFKETF